ncbi:MAG: IS21 family transposase [bacterium]|nr:IS21 family transposase [bacterium]
MHRLSELVRLHRMELTTREVARLLSMSPNTERRYRQALESAQLLRGAADDLPTLAQLQEAVQAHLPEHPLPGCESSVARWADAISKMRDGGASPTAIYDRLRLEQEEFAGSLSAVKRLCLRLKKAKGVMMEDVAIPVETVPGDVAQVDFGSIGLLWDPEAEKLRKAYVFVMVLGYSRHMVARVVFDQKVDTWLPLHVEAFEELGMVPKTLVPDNLKSAVVRAAFDVRDEPVLNRSYRELARHFEFKIDPTPPYSPEKKGKVESGVKYVKNNFFKSRKEEKDAEVLRRALARWVREIAGMRKHGTTHKRPLEVFEQVERPAMLPLPTTRWEPVLWRSPTLGRNCRARVEGARYSAPWRLIGKVLMARVTEKSVELYFENTRVASHERQPEGGESTKDEHLPPERSAYRHRQREYWEERAERIGADVRCYVAEVFDSDDVLSQLTKVQAIVGHLETFPTERALAACRRASFYGSYSYQSIKNILRKGLDMQSLPTAIVPARDELERPRHARTVQELLDLPLEKDNAPN